MTNRRAMFFLLCLALLIVPAVSWALGSDKAMYVGGTVAGLPEKTEGRIDATSTETMIFRADNSNSTMQIPWATVQAIEYGQRVSRRRKTAILITPWALLSKGRKHYVTINYRALASNDQAAVFEFGKGVYRPYLAALKAKSGREVTCQDDEARKYMGGTCALAVVEQPDTPKKDLVAKREPQPTRAPRVSTTPGGRLRVLTDPVGADVYIGDSRVGTTTPEGLLLELLAGTVTVSVRKLGYSSVERTWGCPGRR